MRFVNALLRSKRRQSGRGSPLFGVWSELNSTLHNFILFGLSRSRIDNMTKKTLRNRRRLRFETLEERRLLATYVVSNTADSGTGSLRQAILDSNASPVRDTIAFSISSISKTIEPRSGLPPITDPVTIDATTQPGYAGTPIVELSGKQLSNGENGLLLKAGLSDVRGLVINQFPGCGILIEGPGGNRIESNYVGTDLSGQLAKRNGQSGIQVLNSDNNRIGGPGVGNLTSGNGWEGVRIWGSLSHSNWIQGNRIGTDANGLSAVPNLLVGLVLAGSSRNSIVGADGIDADDPRKGNLVSGNGLDGIRITGSNRNTVAGNWVGVNNTGNAALANNEGGILLDDNATENRIGSNADGINDARERNVIAGNVKSGIRVLRSSDSQIAGNWIGIGVDGIGKLPNGNEGILVDGGSGKTVIGSGVATLVPEAARNVVSGNGKFGIAVYESQFTRISSNFVGIASDGLTAVPNAIDGILVTGSFFTLIGTDGDGKSDLFEGNVISGNTKNGIWLSNADYSRVAGNLIGLSADGTRAVANNHSGIWIAQGSQLNRIGTNGDGISDEAERNIISGNVLQGVSIGGIQSDSNQVSGNYIGTNAVGLASIPNRRNGVMLYNQANRNTIGGSTPVMRNIVSGNIGWGVDIYSNSNGNSIVGNWIGPVGDGLHSLGNSEGGISIFEASNNKIGDGTAETSNSIIGNGRVGIQVSHLLSTGNSFSRNAIANHSVIEIDLGGDGPTLNDANDQDSGPNQLQNYPTIDFVANSSSRVQISGMLESTANTLFHVDLYSEVPGVFGRRFLGTFPVLTNSSGTVPWRYELFSALPTDAKIYATARNGNGSQSEFSPPRSVNLLLPVLVDTSTLREGNSGTMVTIGRPVSDSSSSSDLIVDLSSSASAQIAFPAQVTILAGQPRIQFVISSVDDTIFESVQHVRVVARTRSGEPAMQSFDLSLLDNDSKWHNYASPLNVDGDQGISPLDVLAIVNYLNSNLSQNLFTATVPIPLIYIDTDDDQTVSPLDVLLVINFLNNRVSVVGEGESEAISFAVDWSTTESIGTMGRHLRIRTARQIPPG